MKQPISNRERQAAFRERRQLKADALFEALRQSNSLLGLFLAGETSSDWREVAADAFKRHATLLHQIETNK